MDGCARRAPVAFCCLQRGHDCPHSASSDLTLPRGVSAEFPAVVLKVQNRLFRPLAIGSRSSRAPMPKVVFVNEHRIVEVPQGKNLKTLALELGVDPHREFFRGVNCGYLGLCGLCQVWVRESAPGSTNRRNFRESMAGMRGERRLACQVQVLGDVA